MSKTQRRTGLVVLLAASILGLSASSAFAWSAHNFNAVDLGTNIYGAVTVCVRTPQNIDVRYRIDSDYSILRRRFYPYFVDSGCTRLRWKTRDDFRNGLVWNRIRVDA